MLSEQFGTSQFKVKTCENGVVENLNKLQLFTIFTQVPN